MRRAARVDANHAEVVAVLRACGWYVLDTSRVGGGFVDCIAAKHGVVRFIEIKDGTKPLSAQALTKPEATLHGHFAAAGVPVRLVRSVAEALALE
jgi:Holliday junction resolvase-like predicted endonuclease